MKGGDKMGKFLFIGAVIVIVGIAGFSFLSNQKPFEQEVARNNIPSNTLGTEDAKDAQDEDSANQAGLNNRYLAYSDANLAKATSDGGRAVVFFHAGWCPSCKAAEADFKANFDQVPPDVSILKTDYDTAIDLKQKYNITMQDTFVQIDKDGNEMSKWNSGGEGIKALLANIK